MANQEEWQRSLDVLRQSGAFIKPIEIFWCKSSKKEKIEQATDFDGAGKAKVEIQRRSIVATFSERYEKINGLWQKVKGTTVTIVGMGEIEIKTEEVSFCTSQLFIKMKVELTQSHVEATFKSLPTAPPS